MKEIGKCNRWFQWMIIGLVILPCLMAISLLSYSVYDAKKRAELEIVINKRTAEMFKIQKDVEDLIHGLRVVEITLESEMYLISKDIDEIKDANRNAVCIE